MPVGTISIAGGTIGVSFRVDKNEVDPAEVKSKLNSQLGILSPYLADVVVTGRCIPSRVNFNTILYECDQPL